MKPEAFLYAFDLLALNGQDMRRKPIEARKAALAKLLASARGSNGIHFVDHLDFEDAAMVFAHACSLGCEGIVSKRKGSPYKAGRSRDWLKTKNPARQQCGASNLFHLRRHMGHEPHSISRICALDNPYRCIRF